VPEKTGRALGSRSVYVTDRIVSSDTFKPTVLACQIQKVLDSQGLIWHDEGSLKAPASSNFPNQQAWIGMTKSTDPENSFLSREWGRVTIPHPASQDSILKRARQGGFQSERPT
jgi:hypothetical protein